MQEPQTSVKSNSLLLSALIHAGVLGLIFLGIVFEKHTASDSAQPVSVSDINRPSKASSVSAAKASAQTAPRTPPVETKTEDQVGSANTQNSDSSASASGKSVGISENGTSSAYFSDLQRRIQEQERYPIEAQKRGISGTVVVHFQLNDQGQIIEIQSISPEKPLILVEAALSAVRAASPFPAPPAGISKDFRIPVDFKIK